MPTCAVISGLGKLNDFTANALLPVKSLTIHLILGLNTDILNPFFIQVSALKLSFCFFTNYYLLIISLLCK